MELLLLSFIFFTACLITFKPEKEKLANRCLGICIAASIAIWLLATWEMLVPAGNI